MEVGYKYEGEYNEHYQRHGMGKAEFPNGDKYEGQGSYQNGKRNGFGKYTFSNGASYNGEWKDGKKHGLGIFMYPDGSKYDGVWHEDMRQGYGKYFYSNGDYYEGEWLNHLRHGRGKYAYASSNLLFTGIWFEGKRTGEGVVTRIGDDSCIDAGASEKLSKASTAKDDKNDEEAAFYQFDDFHAKAQIAAKLSVAEEKQVEGAVEAAPTEEAGHVASHVSVEGLTTVESKKSDVNVEKVEPVEPTETTAEPVEPTEQPLPAVASATAEEATKSEKVEVAADEQKVISEAVVTEVEKDKEVVETVQEESKVEVKEEVAEEKKDEPKEEVPVVAEAQAPIVEIPPAEDIEKVPATSVEPVMLVEQTIEAQPPPADLSTVTQAPHPIPMNEPSGEKNAETTAEPVQAVLPPADDGKPAVDIPAAENVEEQAAGAAN
ncbi:hypothetical protein HELRODRAFT_188091 [Helobdella robusta]|uniref:Uncharacterized protein n=1 Tax=Helobdella robusta TaxID=6412 RepID=T1FPM2_HELRO|nr:hypothetical protein HELRODRAFT_188091 [Helobdella robusta]ESO13057.1 hypothetical protein HELRODRAFT_188091 [Helobdella robusta]